MRSRLPALDLRPCKRTRGPSSREVDRGLRQGMGGERSEGEVVSGSFSEPVWEEDAAISRSILWIATPKEDRR